MSAKLEGNVITVAFNFQRWYRSSTPIVGDFAPFDSGTWTFACDGGPTVRVSCHNGTESVAIESVKLSTWCSSKAGLDLSVLDQIPRFPPSKDWTITCPVTAAKLSSHHTTCSALLTVMIKDSVLNQPPDGSDSKGSTLMKRNIGALRNPVAAIDDHTESSYWFISGYLHSYSPNDVVFDFPRVGRQLWANSTTLTTTSPYFKTLLNAGFSESNITSTELSLSDTGSQYSFTPGSSDDETDRATAQQIGTRPSPGCPPGVRKIVITETAYTTYHAVLGWIIFGSIEFAPLSGFSPQAATSTPPSKRLKLSNDEPNMPLAASPKSVYKLAHLLELPTLIELALYHFKLGLTVENALWQLTTEVAVHDEIREAVAAFAKDNWPAIKASEALAELSKVEVLERLECGVKFAARLAELVRKC